MLILVVGSFLASHRAELNPNKLQNLFEAILEFFINLTDSILQDRSLSQRVFPFVCTFFLLIVFSNWLGLLPGVGTIGLLSELHGQIVLTPILRPTNADLNATLSWAIISVIMIQVFGIMALGFFKYFSKYFNIKSLLLGTFEGFVGFGVGILELFSEISKMISFSFRLFGNIFAGEVLLTVIAFLLPYIVPVPFHFLELFVGLIQGLVFTMLTLVFIKLATISHDHQESGVTNQVLGVVHQ
jgi:F-type H+-transporting ATPase subunit a